MRRLVFAVRALVRRCKHATGMLLQMLMALNHPNVARCTQLDEPHTTQTHACCCCLLLQLLMALNHPNIDHPNVARCAMYTFE